MMRKTLYIDALMWAHEHAEGFSRIAIRENLRLNEEENLWIEANFFSGKNDNSALVQQIGTTNIFSLGERGMSAAVDYIELKEARQSSKTAMKWAIISLLVAIVTGMGQIWVGLVR